MDEEALPPQVTYWLSAESKHDCFFVVGPESGLTERIGAFKTLLAGHSEPLRNMLEDSKLREKGDIPIPDTDPNTFKMFLKCIYGSGHCDCMIEKLTFEDSVKLLYVIEKYLVSTVKNKLIEYILSQLPVSPEVDAKTIKNVFTALSNPVCLQDTQLEKAVSNLIQCNVEQIFSHEKFVDLSSAALLFIVKQDTLSSSEGDIWWAVLKWAKHASKSDDPLVQREHINEHIKYIRFLSMNSVFFTLSVAITGILKPEEVNEVFIYNVVKNISDLKYINKVATPRCSPREVVSSTEVFTGLKISYRIKNISKLKVHHCDLFQCMKSSWLFCVAKIDNRLGILLFCDGNPIATWWSYEVEWKFTVWNQQNRDNYKSKTIIQTLTPAICCATESLSWEWLLNKSNGFVKDDSIIVTVKIISVVEE